MNTRKQIVNLNYKLRNSPMQYIINLRIENARDLLLSGEVNVTEAARLSGFEDIYYFSTLFKRKTGSTPTELLRKG